jgi:hypothetical protein
VFHFDHVLSSVEDVDADGVAGASAIRAQTQYRRVAASAMKLSPLPP